jgi:hypothetical protein
VIRNAVLLAAAAFGLTAGLGGTPAPAQTPGILIAAFAALVGALLIIFTDELGELFDDGTPRPSARPRRTSS